MLMEHKMLHFIAYKTEVQNAQSYLVGRLRHQHIRCSLTAVIAHGVLGRRVNHANASLKRSLNLLSVLQVTLVVSQPSFDPVVTDIDVRVDPRLYPDRLHTLTEDPIFTPAQHGGLT